MSASCSERFLTSMLRSPRESRLATAAISFSRRQELVDGDEQGVLLRAGRDLDA